MPDWQAEILDWVDSALARHSLTRVGAAEPIRASAWAIVLRIPTSNGAVFFKASSSEQIYEAGLTQRLALISPACLPTVLAVEPQRGWLLLADGGMRLREQLRTSPDLPWWEKILPIYAELQIQLAGHLPELAALGVPDSSPGQLLEMMISLLEQEKWLNALPEQALVVRVRNLLPTLLDQCMEVSNYFIPISLHHGDFHDGNIFTGNGHPIFFDWGDSSLSHPFFSIRTTFVSIENALGLPETHWDSSPQFTRLRDLYLEPWQRFETPRRLLEAWRIAIKLSSLSSVFSWQRALASAPASQYAEYQHIIPGLLQEWVDNCM